MRYDTSNFEMSSSLRINLQHEPTTVTTTTTTANDDGKLCKNYVHALLLFRIIVSHSIPNRLHGQGGGQVEQRKSTNDEQTYEKANEECAYSVNIEPATQKKKIQRKYDRKQKITKYAEKPERANDETIYGH